MKRICATEVREREAEWFSRLSESEQALISKWLDECSNIINDYIKKNPEHQENFFSVNVKLDVNGDAK